MNKKINIYTTLKQRNRKVSLFYMFYVRKNSILISREKAQC